MNLNEVIESIGNKSGFRGVTIRTSPKLNKFKRGSGRGKNGIPCPYVGVTKVSTFSCMIGVDYTEVMKRHTGDTEFVAQKPFGKHDTQWHGILQSDTDENKYYLHLDCVGGHKSKWYIGDREATAEEVKDICENYTTPSKPNSAGVLIITPSIDNVIAIV